MLSKRFLCLFFFLRSTCGRFIRGYIVLWHRWHTLRLTHDPAGLQRSLGYSFDKIEPIPVACLYFQSQHYPIFPLVQCVLIMSFHPGNIHDMTHLYKLLAANWRRWNCMTFIFKGEKRTSKTDILTQWTVKSDLRWKSQIDDGGMPTHSSQHTVFILNNNTP